MIATNDTGPLGGTADIDYEFTGTVCYEADFDYESSDTGTTFTIECDGEFAGSETVCYEADISDRNRYIQECRMKLFASFGAVVTKLYRLLYWPVPKQSIARSILDRRPQVILAGVMSRSRGIHWNRNNRR